MTPRTVIEPARLAGGALLRTQSDERLVDLVRAGNDRAFEAIVHRYRAQLLRYCRRFLPPGRAEDAVQQAFLNAFRAIGADERPIDLRPWLYRIAHNASLTALRSGAAEEPISDEIDGVERPDQAVERRQSLADVVAAVQALPPRQRDALILHELEGRSYEQIAAELKISGGAVRQLLSRARTTLRAGATAIVPEWALVRLASAGNEPVAARVAEIVVAGGGTAVIAKVGTAFVVAGAVAVGAAEGPVDVTGDERKQKREAVSAAATAGGAGGSTGGAGKPAAASTPRGDAAERRERVKARSRDDRRPSGGRDRSRDNNEDREDGFIRTDDDGGSGSDSTGDDSGSGSIEDRSGSNSGSDGGDSSGPGSGGDDSPDSSGPGDGTVLSQEPVGDDSGSGSSGSGSGGDSSGSGSSGSGSGSGSSGSSDSSGSGSDDD